MAGKNQDQPMMDVQQATKRRSSNRGQMTKQLQKADGILQKGEPQQCDLDLLTATISNIEKRTKTIEDLDEIILQAAEDEETYEHVFEEADDYNIQINEHLIRYKLFLERSTIAAEKAAQPTASADTVSIASITPSTQRRQVNLPKLQLPTFNGDCLKWTTFIDTFKAAVDDDPTLEDIQKFQYLSAQLVGEAARTVEGLQLTNANYIEAMQLLKNRYGQTHKIISSHMKALWSLPIPSTNTESIRAFYDSLEKHTRGLKALGKAEDSYGELLVPIVFEKLPASVKTQISRAHGDKAWTIQELKDAIHKEIQANQAASDIENMRETSDIPSSTATSFHIGTKPMPKKSCIFCNGSHPSGRCTTVTDRNKRIEVLSRNKSCFNCFGPRHKSTDCWSKFSCRNCGKKHHTSICDQAKQHEKSHNRNGEKNVTHVKLTPTSGPVLLKTTRGTVSSEIRSISVNVLLDEGAQRTFITEETARSLSIRDEDCQTEHLNLGSFGNEDTGIRAIKATDIKLKTKSGDITMRTLIVPKISSPVTS